MNFTYKQNIVVDLEFTPSSGEARANGLLFEIIQIGAVRVDSKGNTLDTFESFVKPTYAQSISWPVKKLTKIRETDLRGAKPLDAVLDDFLNWIGEEPTRFIEWSPSDWEQLVQETAYKNISFPIQSARWLDLQRIFPKLINMQRRRRRLALNEAAQTCGILVSKENLHGALYDAMLTAELLGDFLSGDYLKNKETALHFLVTPESRKPLTANLGSKFAALAELKECLAS